MDKIVASSEQTPEEFGGFNSAPPNWKEITMEEFAHSSFFVYSPIGVEYRQFPFPDLSGRDVVQGVKLFFMYDKTGFGLVSDYWGKRVRVFKFAVCEHEYVELSAKAAKEKGISHYGHCWHVHECTKCGNIMSYDSSD